MYRRLNSGQALDAPVIRLVEIATFLLAGYTLYLYTEGLYEGGPATLALPEEIQYLNKVIDRFRDLF